VANKKIILGSVNLNYIDDTFQWYAIVTQFNYEKFYVNNLIQGIEGTKLESQVDEFFVPIKKILNNPFEVYEYKKAPKISIVKDAYSFYVFIKCKLSEELWCFLRETTGVAVIPTVGGIPRPVSEQEIYKTKCFSRPQGFLRDYPKNKNGSLIKELRECYDKYVALPWKVREGFVPLSDEELLNQYEEMSCYGGIDNTIK
jgi:transcription antitermination factor NusG